MNSDLLTKLADSLVDGDADLAYALTNQALEAGYEPVDIIDSGLMAGMDIVGEKYSTGEYFLPDLIIAAEGMQRSMELLEPELIKREQQVQSAGIVVLGTVKGDIHAIGKSLVATMLTANGFRVYDLGVDVSSDTFIAKVKETGASLLGLSALLTTTMVAQREVIAAIEEAGIRSQVKIMVGGAPVTKSWAEEIGADGYSEDALGAVRLAQGLIKE